MDDDQITGPEGVPEEEADDVSDESMGEPIAALLGHAMPAPSGLMPRVRNSIFRRTLAGDVTRFAAWGPITALLELLRAIFESFGGVEARPRTDESEEA